RWNHMHSLDSFYQRSDNNYAGTEEYRPRLVKIDGQIKLVLTRVEKIAVSQNRGNAEVFEQIDQARPAKMLLANPTSAAKIRLTATGREKWVPLSLSKPIDYKELPNRATAGVKIGNETRYFNLPLSKDLPPRTYAITYDKDQDTFFANTVETTREDNGHIKIEAKPTVAVSVEVDQQIRDTLASQEVDLATVDRIGIDIFHTRQPEVIDGEYHSVVHGQRQHGTFFKEETYPASEQAQFRDEYFYAITGEVFSEAFPPDREPRSGGLQTGKTWDFDDNDKYCGKPIENGTQFLGQHRHLFELAEILMGIPKGGMIAFAAALDRSGGFERMIHKPHFAKLVLYCREKGWLSGVSEDEQGVLSLALALGYYLKYQLKVTAFEAQPNTYGQLNTQDAQRYNTALALGEDALQPYEMRELAKRGGGKRIAGSWKQKFEHLAFRLWYEWPKAELARQGSPIVFLLSNGRVKPYIVDPYFLFSWSFDFLTGLVMYANMRDKLGRNKEFTDASAYWWSFVRGPAMNQAFFFQSHRGILELFRKGWQYGQFVITALSRSANVPEENKNFLQHLIALQGTSVLFGLAMTLPGAIAMGDPSHAFTLDYAFNEVWATYAAVINGLGLRYMRQCEVGNPEGKGPEADAFKARREEAVRRINAASDETGNRFFEAYQAFRQGNRQQAAQAWRQIIAEEADYKVMNFVLLSEQMLEQLGVPLPQRGKIAAEHKSSKTLYK
ncbi:MAG: hypothetical protein PHT59_07045, partial [Candidatus Omnitrophica bacterium]|nr:hypothetical protein [Candidatus Omnitrophota bacterium]